MESKIDLSLLDGLSEDEKKYALQILKEISNSGSSKTYDNLKYSDYKEIPVDIETFLTDDRYLGIPWKDKNGNLKLYPFWLDVLKKLFPNNLETAYDTLLESGARGLGKAQPLYSKLLTSDGFITMGEVKVGDFIYGEDGKTHRVTHIFPQGEKDVYEITFSDNTTVRCCKEHLWTIIQKWNHNKKYTMSLEEIMNRGLKANATKRGAIGCRFGVPITSPLEFEHKDVFISPYTLGVLIGDGYICGNSICFTSTDDEIIDRVNSELLSNKYTLSKYRDSYNIVNIDKSHVGRAANVNKYKQAIHNLKLAVRSDEKFIPKDYLLTDVESRIQLLQGLMDTDGYIDKKGYLTYCTTSKRLKDDFIFLVQSLGGTAPCRVKRGKYRNAEGVVVECKNCYDISVNLPSCITPFHLTRKLNRLNVNKHEPFRTIRGIAFIGKEECQCILIDSDTHLYLTDNLIVTHNSEIACGAVCAYLMYRVMCLKDPLEFFHLKPTEKIAFAFMNIKLDLSEAIANDKFQKTIQMSPWFMSKGTMTQRHNKPYWIPPEPIEIIIGSQADDIIGRPIFFCLDGETQIKTLGGIHKIKDLVDKNIQVISIDENGNECVSETCTVKPTLKTNEEYQIELEDGSIIKCTSTHRFMLKDGSYKMTKDLTEDDELFSEDTVPFGYIYKFVNLKTNKIYIGKREKSSFDESYYGSGKLWKQDLEKYGKENIKREILCFGYSRSELNELEKYYIKLHNSQDKNIGYNIHKGGQGGNSINDAERWSEMHKGAKNGRYDKEVTKETRSKISKANKGRGLGIKNSKKGRPDVKKPDGFGEKISIALKKRTRSEAELIRLREFAKIGAEKNRGKKRSLETRQKISIALRGHRGLKGKDNPMYGKHRSSETRRKISEKKIGKNLGGNNSNSRKVICVETGEIFNSIVEAREKYSNATHISDCCNGKIKTSGKLHWRYYNED